MEPLAWQEVGTKPVIGVDKIWITAGRDGEYRKKVVPLLNIGGLVRYKIGKGGIILNQLRIQATEPNPVNAEKKQAIVSTLLCNLGASFAAEKTLIAGANMDYHPIPLDDKCNQFLTSDKWLDSWPARLGSIPRRRAKTGGRLLFDPRLQDVAVALLHHAGRAGRQGRNAEKRQRHPGRL